MSTVVIIEATGKKNTLEALLKASDFPHVIHPVCVLATKGHVCRLPQDQPALDNYGHMTRTCVDPARRTEIATIRRAAEKAKSIVIATDDDDEGNVIARDVALHALSPKQTFWRCRLRALDRQSLVHALTQAICMTPSEADADAQSGDVRRLVDYAIGFGLSKSVEKYRIPVGRVFSSTLMEISQKTPEKGLQTIIAPAQDGGAPFLATIKSGIKQFFPEIPALSVQKNLETTGIPAWNYKDAVSAIATKTKTSVADVNASLQRTYEHGLASYPRTYSSTISTSGLDACQAIANRHGASFTRPQQIYGTKNRGAHEAIRPTLAASLEQRTINDLDATTALMIARQAIRSGQEYLIEIPDHTKLPLEIRATGAVFSRVTLRGFLGWKEPKGSEWQPWANDVALLNFLAENDLGRPGTWSRHINRLLQRGVLTDALQLSRLGALYASTAAECGFSSNTSQKIEHLIASLEPREAGAATIEILRESLPSHAFEETRVALNTTESTLLADYQITP